MITTYRQLSVIHDLAVHELLDLPTGAYPDKAALIYFGSEMTFLRAAAANPDVLPMLWPDSESKKGERVGLHLPNCPQYLIAYYAVLSIGGIVVNLNPLYTPDELKLMANTSGMTSLVTFDMALPAIRTLCKQVNDSPGDRHRSHGLYQRISRKHFQKP